MNDIDETAYLLNSPENASRLIKAIAEYEQGLGNEQKLIEYEDSKSEKLDSLTKENYQNHFKLKTKANRMSLLHNKKKHI